MEDRDFVTRFVSFFMTPYTEYEPDLDSFMTKGMSLVNTLDDKARLSMKNDFSRAMEISLGVFGDDAFRKRKNKDDRRKPLNKALFETLSVAFGRLSQEQGRLLIARKEFFLDKFIKLNNDIKFEQSLSSATGHKESVLRRFSEIEKIVNETIR